MNMYFHVSAIYIHCIYMYNVYLEQDVHYSKMLCVIITSQLLTH